MLSPDRVHDFDPLSRDAADYEIVRRAIAFVSEHWRTQPEIEAIAAAAGVSAGDLHHLFRRWAGITPKAFLQALTLDHARGAAAGLRQRARRLVRGRPFRPGTAARPLRHPRSDVAGGMEVRRRRADHVLRLSPLPVRHRAGDGDRARTCRACLRRSRRGTGRARRHAKPLAAGEHRRGHAPRTAPLAARIFDPRLWRANRPLRVVLIGTDFEVRVWETLLEDSVGPGNDLFRHRREAPGAQGRARRGRGGRQEPGLLRGALPPGAGQERRHHRLSLGPHPQARHAGLGDWAGSPPRSSPHAAGDAKDARQAASPIARPPPR